MVAAIGAVIHVDGVACRPGHPQVLAESRGRWLVGLAGNPFAARVTAYTLLQPLLAGLTGRVLPPLPVAAVTGDMSAVVHQTRIVPVRWHALK